MASWGVEDTTEEAQAAGLAEGEEAEVSHVWAVRSFQSGTVIVDRQHGHLPHYYVHGYYVHRASEAARYRVAEQLRDWLNGGERLVWMDNAYRDSETRLTHEDGFAITATGPMVDREPGAGDWVENDSREAKDARARLIDQLAGLEVQL